MPDDVVLHINDLIFTNLVAFMGLDVASKPSVLIKTRLENTPQRIVTFIHDFVEGKIDSDVKVGLLDILGNYNSESHSVTLYYKAIEMCANQLYEFNRLNNKEIEIESEIFIDILKDVVMAHELAHAATHLGIDGGKEIWATFERAPTDVKEYFAQWYAHTFWSRQNLQLHEDLMITLADFQPEIYGTYRKDLLLDLATMNSRLLLERKKSTDGIKQEQLCEFCKIRIATENVSHLDTWLGKSWSIPACAVCAPHHQQTWLT